MEEKNRKSVFVPVGYDAFRPPGTIRKKNDFNFFRFSLDLFCYSLPWKTTKSDKKGGEGLTNAGENDTTEGNQAMTRAAGSGLRGRSRMGRAGAEADCRSPCRAPGSDWKRGLEPAR